MIMHEVRRFRKVAPADDHTLVFVRATDREPQCVATVCQEGPGSLASCLTSSDLTVEVITRYPLE